MTVQKTLSAKITRPVPVDAMCRHRLFALLDGAPERPIIWVSAPAGAGKTTLVASYLAASERPCIWYTCDEGDADPATFFHYMSLAAREVVPRRRVQLPPLSPEYLAGFASFTRRYFEQLYRCLLPRRPGPDTGVGAGGIIVLDNYQDVPDSSPFHDMVATGLDGIPAGIRVVVISRDGLPTPLARLQANNRIALLGYGDVRFTPEESQALVRERVPSLGDEALRQVYDMTHGWAAGIILTLATNNPDTVQAGEALQLSYDGVFAYFAGEIFNRLEPGLQDFLLKTAFLPQLSIPLADGLTGSGSAGRILPAMHQSHLFIEKLAGSSQTYLYHPMLREFLLNRAKLTLPPHELTAVQQKGAQLMAQAGQAEDAARLYLAAGDRAGLARLVKEQACRLLRQGRNRTVAAWLSAMPAETADDPWLLYWSGICSFPGDMARAQDCFDRAFMRFRTVGDREGVCLTWAAMVDIHVFGDDWRRLDDDITLFEGLQAAWTEFPSQETELVVSSRMLMALTLRKTDQPDWVEGWQRRVHALLQETPSTDIQMETTFCLCVYHLWRGDYDKNLILLERAEAEMRRHRPSPFTVIRIKLMKGVQYWVLTDYDAARQTFAEGLAIATDSGTTVFDSLMWGFSAAADMAAGIMDRAGEALRRQLNALLGPGRALDVYFYHINAAWYALLNDNQSLAAEHLTTGAGRVAKMGSPYYDILWTIGMARTAFLQGRGSEARDLIRSAHGRSLAMKSRVMEWYALLSEAWFELQEGRSAEGVELLRRALPIGRRHGYVHLEFYLPSAMCLVCATALAEGIEPEYVTQLVKKLSLPPPGAGGGCAMVVDQGAWPYPIKIHTLGRFQIIRDGVPLHFTGKEQKKPLELLKALIAFGGCDVPKERLTDAIWPDADGDQASKSLETTLSRLRRLLGSDDCICYQARQLSINPTLCWVDSLALWHLFDTNREIGTSRSLPLEATACRMYTGAFLPTDAATPWVMSRREQLKHRMVRLVVAAGYRHEQAGEWGQAAEQYAAGIEIDNLAEEAYRRLMICQQRLGNYADAARTYHRCRSALHAELGIAPSPETTTVYSAVAYHQ